MYRVLLLIVFVSSTKASQPDCKVLGVGKYPAEECQRYYRCYKTLWWYHVRLETCPEGQTFNSQTQGCTQDDNCGTTTTYLGTSGTTTDPHTCEGTTTETSSVPTENDQDVTTKKTASPPDCKSKGVGNYPASNCRQYYRCYKIMFWYKVKLETCPEGSTFDNQSRECVVGDNCDQTDVTTTEGTTTNSEIPATCSSKEPAGTTVNDETTVPSSQNTGTTTEVEDVTKVTSSITKQSATPPDCKSVGVGNYPAEDCRRYYRCYKKMWWYKVQLETCPDGETFNTQSGRCDTGNTCDGTESSTTESTEVHTSTSLPVDTEDESTLTENLMTSSVYQDGTTIGTDEGSLTETTTTNTIEETSRDASTTSSGEGAVTETASTVPADEVTGIDTSTTKVPTSPPKCREVGAGKYPAENHDQYYRCYKVLWWFMTRLETCPEGQVFSGEIQKCVCSCSERKSVISN